MFEQIIEDLKYETMMSDRLDNAGVKFVFGFAVLIIGFFIMVFNGDQNVANLVMSFGGAYAIVGLTEVFVLVLGALVYFVYYIYIMIQTKVEELIYR